MTKKFNLLLVAIFAVFLFAPKLTLAAVTINFNDVTQTSAKIYGSVTDGTQIRVVWGDNPDNLSHSYIPFVYPDGTFINQLTLLTPVHTYYFKAIDAGNSSISYSAIKYFKTAPTSVLINHSNVTDTSATIGGVISDGNGPVVIVWGKFPLLLDHTFIPNIFQTNFEKVLTDLEPNTTYYYKAINSFNPTLPIAEQKFFKTQTQKVIITPANIADTSVSMTGTTSNSFLKIRILLGQQPNVFTKTFDVDTKDLDNNPDTLRTFFKDIDGLSPGVIYYYMVVDPLDQKKILAGVKSFQTGAVHAVLNFKNVGDTTAEFYGTVEPRGLPLRILWGTDPVTYGHILDPVIKDVVGLDGTVKSGSFEELLVGLEPETTYYFQAVSPVSQGTVYADQGEFKTLPTFTPTSNLGGDTVNSGTPVTFEQPTGGLVPCGGKNDNGSEQPPCDFHYLIVMANIIIRFLLFTLAMPLAAILFAYAGWLYLSSGANPGQRDKAKHIFIDVLIGFVIALAAWLIINTIMTGLGYTGLDLLKS